MQFNEHFLDFSSHTRYFSYNSQQNVETWVLLCLFLWMRETEA